MNAKEKILFDAVGAWIAASQADDFAVLNSMVTDDVVFLAPGRTPIVGRDFWAANRDRPMPGVKVRCQIRNFAVYGPAGHSWCELRLIIPAADGAAEVRVEGHTLSLWRKSATDGKWRLAREARLLAPAR